MEQLEYVAAVARGGSIRHAAEEVSISQPALSETVRNLERELGVDILDRRTTGATISQQGRELLPYVQNVLDAIDRIRSAADERHRVSRMVRLGSVSGATSMLVAPAIRRFREQHPDTQVELRSLQQSEIHRGLRDGSLDLGLVNYLEGDDPPPELETTTLIHGRPVVCLRPDSPLAAKPVLHASDLVDVPLVMMRAGYVMHRYVHRILAGTAPICAYSADGAEMGKLMVAEGLGVTVLPDYSVIGDPLERNGTITHRAIADDTTRVLLVLQWRRSDSPPRSTRALHTLIAEYAITLPETRNPRTASTPPAQTSSRAATSTDLGETQCP
jgi:DNA-binding transcriptional LysR family regulator